MGDRPTPGTTLLIVLNLPRLLYPVYERRLLRELEGAKQPGHVAIMCDGNRRWAREAGFVDVSHGHRVGAKKIGEMVRWCDDVDVKLVTVYLLSTENLGRDEAELDLLYGIIGDVVDELSLPESNCRVRLVGHLDVLPKAFAKRLRDTVCKTVDNSGVARRSWMLSGTCSPQPGMRGKTSTDSLTPWMWIPFPHTCTPPANQTRIW